MITYIFFDVPIVNLKEIKIEMTKMLLSPIKYEISYIRWTLYSIFGT